MLLVSCQSLGVTDVSKCKGLCSLCIEAHAYHSFEWHICVHNKPCSLTHFVDSSVIDNIKYTITSITSRIASVYECTRYLHCSHDHSCVSYLDLKLFEINQTDLIRLLIKSITADSIFALTLAFIHWNTVCHQAVHLLSQELQCTLIQP